MAVPTVRREEVLAFRVRQHQLDRPAASGAGPADVALLDYGVQDTGPDGAAWALALRGGPSGSLDDLALTWTLRGAPHAYRRSALGAVAVATAPLSEADAAKRIFDAAKPLKAAGIPVLGALRVIADHLRDIVTTPTVKGDASTRLTALLDEPYLRACRPCGTTHAYEMPFRLAALHAGLELEAGTSPPVLRRIPGLRPERYGRLAGEADAGTDVIRNHLRFYGPTRVGDVARFLDAPVKEVKAHWPADAVEVAVADGASVGRPGVRFVLEADLDALTGARSGSAARTVRLLGPYDPYLQLRDRELLVADEQRRKDLWRVLGRPGAIVADGEILGTWRPRASGRGFTVRIDAWAPLDNGDRSQVEEQAERLAAHRGAVLTGVVEH
ncbi:MAG: winged helix DNA-binding domain-containing protein [Actinobacteria bacterium]|nr:winged helix DNA-binding domain-containing protein [Actinomycetota bacterium]